MLDSSSLSKCQRSFAFFRTWCLPSPNSNEIGVLFHNELLCYVPQEVVKRPFKVTDRLRQIRKGIVAKSLKDLMKKSVDKLGYDERQDVYLVLEEVRLTFRPRYLPMRLNWQDGTEIDDEEYFQCLPDNTTLWGGFTLLKTSQQCLIYCT